MKKVLKLLLLGVVLAAISYSAGRYGWFIQPTPKPSLEFMRAEPSWVFWRGCTPLNADERAKYELAVEALRTYIPPDYLRTAAIKHFGKHRFLKDDSGDVTRFCPPTYLLPEVAELALMQGVFVPGRVLHTDPLRLARVLGPHDQRIVEAVAHTAFYPHPISTEYPELKRDIRSLARVTLAEFGPAAAQWSQQAFDAMSTNDALGTKAAQIAVRTGHPHALERASKLLQDLLDQHPQDPIPWRIKERAYDLAYAIAWAGPEAREYASPLMKLLSRKVENPTAHMGTLHVTPTSVCGLLMRIGGTQAEAIASSEACSTYPKAQF